MHTYKSNNNDDQFDMIIGEDLIFELGIKLDFDIASITQDGITRPMHSVTTSLEKLLQIQEDN